LRFTLTLSPKTDSHVFSFFCLTTLYNLSYLPRPFEPLFPPCSPGAPCGPRARVRTHAFGYNTTGGASLAHSLSSLLRTIVITCFLSTLLPSVFPRCVFFFPNVADLISVSQLRLSSAIFSPVISRPKALLVRSPFVDRPLLFAPFALEHLLFQYLQVEAQCTPRVPLLTLDLLPHPIASCSSAVCFYDFSPRTYLYISFFFSLPSVFLISPYFSLVFLPESAANLTSYSYHRSTTKLALLTFFTKSTPRAIVVHLFCFSSRGN